MKLDNGVVKLHNGAMSNQPRFTTGQSVIIATRSGDREGTIVEDRGLALVTVLVDHHRRSIIRGTITAKG